MPRNLPARKAIRRHRTLPSALRIAIIIRTKDRPHLLTRSLQSLASQKRLPDEVIVINDGGIAIDDMVSDFSGLNIHLINNTNNRGRAQAGNQGVQATECDVIAFLDDDDRFLSDHLQRLEKAMLHFDARVVYSGCRLLKRELLGEKVILQENAIGEFNDPYDAKRLRYENYIPLINLLIDRALWQSVGGFDESFDVFEDWDVLQRLSTQTHFYHLNRITTEYAVWGNSQITQRIDHARWRKAYRQFLKKHVMPLPAPKKLKLLTEYWLVSQERRGIVQDTLREKQALQLKLNQNYQSLKQVQLQLAQCQNQNQQLQSDYAQLESNWSTKYEQLQSDSAKQRAQLESDYEQLQSDSAKQRAQLESDYEQLQSECAKQRAQLESDYEQLQSDSAKQTAQLESDWRTKYEHLQSHNEELQKTLHELSKQIAVGMTSVAVEKILQSQVAPTAAVVGDYQQLTDWIRAQVEQLVGLEQQLAAQVQPLRTESHQLREQLASLVKATSRWPHLRRYASLVQAIAQRAEIVISQTEQYISTSTDISMGLKGVLKHDNSTPDEIPPPRPLSDVYPTFRSLAGTAENPQLMQSVNQLGKQAFMLEAGKVLAFTVHCTLDNFCQLDIFLGTCLRINACHMRVIIRALNTPLRVLYLEGVEIFDNRFHSIPFEPIADSAGKTYQIEIESPDANEQSVIAVWCHSKKPQIDKAPPLEQHSLQTLPHQLQQDLLAFPVSARLRTQSAPHLFILSGLTESTPVLNLHLFLARLNHTDSYGQIVVCGQLNSELEQYCQQHQLTTLQDQLELRAVLEWGKSQEQAQYLWCCELDAQPQPDIVERAMEIFVTNPKAALLVPMEKHSNGTIRAGYASLERETVLAGAPADHPAYAYRRTVDATSSQLVIIKMTALSQLDLSQMSAYHTPQYQLTELIWQLKDQQYEAIYDAAVCYEHDQAYPELTAQALDSRYFYERWHPTFAQQATVLVIDATLPMYDEDSGSLRLYTLLKIWVSLGYRITFFPDNLDSQFKYRHALEALGVEVYHGNYNLADAMAQRQFDFAFICRVDIGHRYIPFVRFLSPQTVIFYDTVDIHYIREQRQAEIENNPKLAASAQATKRKELSNCLLADRVITVTADDAHHLQEELPHLDYSVIPNIHQQHPRAETGFEQRDGLVFIGNYNHHPNDDAVYYFVEKVLPKIHARLPEVCLYLIGSYMKDKMKALASDTIKVVGWVDEVEPEFAKRRVFVSYLRYGAGMKGKLGHALSLGLPVVSTSIGAEGMGLVGEETALIADNPDDFADAVCRLYTDSVLWEKLSRQGREYIDQHFGETAVREKLRALLSRGD
jgi:glycosyltransferase involved in cell wall biosynthesis